MAVGVAPVKVVEAKPSKAGSVGLLQTLGSDVKEVSDLEIRGGIAFLPEACGPGGANAPCASGVQWDVDADPAIVESNAFVIWAGDKCSAFGSVERDWEGRATRALESMQSFLIERELWTGELAKAQSNPTWPNKYLAHEDSDIVGNELIGVTPLNALACLEQYLGEAMRGREGFIHATRHVATYWASMGLLDFSNGKVTTKLGTSVVAGSGYPGTSPVGVAADGNIWAYATSPIEIELGPIRVFGADEVERMARATNDIEVVAARLVTVSWDGCAHGASHIDIETCDVGGS